MSWLFDLKYPLPKLAKWRIQLEHNDYKIRYKPEVQNSNVDSLSRIYTIEEIKSKYYEQFMNSSGKTNIIINNRENQTTGTLIDSPSDYYIVSPNARQYNFTTGINYKLKSEFGKNQMLPPSKIIGDIRYLKNYDRYIIFIINIINNRHRATYENTYLALINLKQFYEANNISKLVIKIVGQYNNLNWDKIRSVIRYIFTNTKIEIIIYTDRE